MIHPLWTGDIIDGYDAALLRLSKEVDLPVPALVSRSFKTVPNLRVHGFRWGPMLEMTQFVVVRADLCPMLSTTNSSTFCAYSAYVGIDSGMPHGAAEVNMPYSQRK